MPYGLADIKAVLFDVDGTLVDSLPVLIKGLGDTYERFNGSRPGDDQIKSLIGMSLREQFKLHREIPPTEEEMEEMIGFTIDRYEAYSDLGREFVPAIQALERCSEAGIKTALVTSRNTREVGLFLKGFRAAGSVDTVICASDVTNPKPHPECALLACERLGVRPEEAVLVGDSVYDLGAAKAAGIKSIAVTYGSGARHDLEAEMPDLILDTPEELLQWINETIFNQHHATKEEARTT